MLPVADSPHGPGVVGLSCGESARYVEFYACWAGVLVPPGSVQRYGIGYSTAANSNELICQMRPRDEWVWIMDDDHAFEPDVLMRLLDRRVPVVVPFYMQRKPPFWPVLYSVRNPDGSCQHVTFEELAGKTGLYPIVSAGKGGVLIRREVIAKLAGAECVCPYDYEGEDAKKKRTHQPECVWPKTTWFEHRGPIGEDHVFFHEVLQAGFPLWADLDVPLEHITPFKVRPHREDDGTWCPEVHLYNFVNMQLRVSTIPETKES